jgi:hypothetical protein
MLNHVRSDFVRLTVLSMLVITVGAGGCSSGKGIRTSAAGGTTGTGGVTTSTGGSTSTSGGTTSTTGGATSYAGTSGTTGGSTGTTGGTGGGGTGGQGDCICDFVPGGTTGSDAPPCASQIEIASLADVPFVAAPRWVNEYCSDSYYGVQITPDLVATTALVLDAYEIPGPPNCPSCADRVGFQLTEPIAGVTTDTPALNVADRYLRASPGAVFRLRPLLRCNHPLFPDPLPTVLVLPPCTQACASGSSRCDIDQVCYPAGTLFCRSCEGKDAPSCACRTSAGVESDGTKCQYLMTDVMKYGICQGGYCFVSE